MKTTAKTLTSMEIGHITYAARRIVGWRWDYIEAVSLKGKLTELLAADHNDRNETRMLEILLALVDGVRYDLCDANQQTLRKATVTETIGSMILGAEGYFTTDGGETRYVDFS